MSARTELSLNGSDAEAWVTKALVSCPYMVKYVKQIKLTIDKLNNKKRLSFECFIMAVSGYMV